MPRTAAVTAWFARRGGGGGRWVACARLGGMGCRTAEMDRELGEMWGRWGRGVGADRCRCSQHLYWLPLPPPPLPRLPAAYVRLVSVRPSPPTKPPHPPSSFDWRQPACVIYVGAPAPLCTHWKISSLHKNCLKNEICDYILFISGLC